MNVSDGLSASAATGNCQHEVPGAGTENKKGFFGRYLVTLVKNVGRYIADGVKSLCQLFYLSGACCYGVLRFVISPCSSLWKKEKASSESDSQESAPQASEEVPNNSEAVSGTAAGADDGSPSASPESDSQESAPQASEEAPKSGAAAGSDSSPSASSRDDGLPKGYVRYVP